VDDNGGSVETSSKIGSSKRDPLSRTSELVAIEEIVETVVDDLVNMVGVAEEIVRV
jgi:hypothetical protein